jgi:opacity protein-like surface antigen
MRMLGKLALTTAVMVPMVAAPAAAQDYRWDVGVNGGFSWYSSMLDTDAAGTTSDNVRFREGWLAGAQLGYWFTPRVGLRANATYTDRPLRAGGADVISNVNLWSGSGDLMLRLRQPNMDWMGTEMLPYVALGLGAKWINPAGDNFTCVDVPGSTQWECAPFVGETGTNFALTEQRQLMGLVGLGTDVRFTPNFALRLEVNDRIYRPDIYAADAPANASVNLPQGATRVSRTVHEIGVQAGLHLLMGLERPRVVTVAPAPPPPPAPAPPPPPAPVEEAITVCVIDPTTTAGIRMQPAVFRVDQRDTLVVRDGQRIPLSQAVGNVMIARDADWYVRGQPLTLRIGADQLEYLTYQGARQIEADRLVFLGTINGYPVYADRDEVADMVGTLNQLHAAQPGRDLGLILAENRTLRTQLEDVQFLYVPLEATGCVFQPVQIMEQVRKGTDN